MNDPVKTKKGRGRPYGSTNTPKKQDLPSEETPSKSERSEAKNRRDLITKKTLSFLTEDDLNEFNTMIQAIPTKKKLIDISVCHYKFTDGIVKAAYARLLRDFNKEVIEIPDTKIFEEALQLVNGKRIIKCEDGRSVNTMGELLKSLPQLVKKFNNQAEEEKIQDQTQPHDQIQESVQLQDQIQELVQPHDQIQEPVQPHDQIQELVQPHDQIQELVQPHDQIQEPVQPQDSAQAQPEEQKIQDQEDQQHQPVRTKRKEKPEYSQKQWDLLGMEFHEHKKNHAALLARMASDEDDHVDAKEEHEDEKN